MSFFGDLHPSFAGNVVKAMGGAKQGYPVLTRTHGEAAAAPARTPAEILRARPTTTGARTVVRVERLTPTIVEVVVEAPAAARNFEPGQFYRLQNYEARSQKVDGTLLTMEGLALTGAWVDKDKGLLSLIVLEMGGSSDLCALLEPGEPVIVMGPTGTPTEIEPGETVRAGRRRPRQRRAVLDRPGLPQRRQQGALLRRLQEGERPLQGRGDRGAADVVVWCCDEAPGFAPDAAAGQGLRRQHRRGDARLRRGRAGRAADPASTTPTASSPSARDRMMNAVRLARHGVLKPYLKPDHRGDRLDQLAHAMHDEGDLRPVPAAPHRSR